MRVLVDITSLSTTRQKRTSPNQVTIKPLRLTDEGHYEAEVEGPRDKVQMWLNRNGYDVGAYEVVEL